MKDFQGFRNELSPETAFVDSVTCNYIRTFTNTVNKGSTTVCQQFSAVLGPQNWQAKWNAAIVNIITPVYCLLWQVKMSAVKITNE